MLDLYKKKSLYKDNRNFINASLASIFTFIILVFASAFIYNKYSTAFDSIFIYERTNEVAFAIDNTRINAIAYTRNRSPDQEEKTIFNLDKGIELTRGAESYNKIENLLLEYKERFKSHIVYLEVKDNLELDLLLVSGQLKNYLYKIRSYQLDLIRNGLINNSFNVAKYSLDSLDLIYSISDGKDIDTKTLEANLNKIAVDMNLSVSNLDRRTDESIISKSTDLLSKKQEIERKENLASLHGYVIDNAQDNLANAVKVFEFNVSAEKEINKFVYQHAKLDNLMSRVIGETDINKGIVLTSLAIAQSNKLLNVSQVMKETVKFKKGIEFMNRLADILTAYIENLNKINNVNYEIKSNSEIAVKSILLADLIVQEKKEEQINEMIDRRAEAYQVWLLLGLFILLIFIKFYLIYQVVYGFFSLSKDAQLAKEKAINANLVKSKFLANMSHEIRTPMNAVIGMLDLMLSSNLGSQDRNRLFRAKQASNSLMHIIDDILDISKIEAGQLKIERVTYSLNRVLSEVYEIMLVSSEKRGIVLEYNCNCNDRNIYIKGDQLRLKQVLFNIIGNAIKFTDIGKVKLDVTTVEITPELTKLNITVEDTGIGISERNQKHLFEAFKQVDDSTTRVYGGTGLGLTISKELVNLMGGSLIVKSQEGIGSTFTVEMQAETVTAINSTEQAFKTANRIDESIEKLNGMQILLVEDNEINQELMTDLLGRYCELDVCGDGLDAIRLLKSNEYDGVLMDCQMPKMGGFKATEYIRNVLASDIPIIALTASVMQEDRQKAIEVGMQDYISKPINFNYLITSIVNNFSAKKIVTNRIESIMTANPETLRPKELKTLDVIVGIDMSGNNRKLYTMLLYKFIEKYKKVQSDSWSNRVLEVHTLKGVSSNLGATRLYALCEKYEVNETDKYFTRLINELSSVLKYTSALLDGAQLITASYGRGENTAIIVDDDEISQLVLKNTLDGLDIRSITTTDSYYALDLVYLCSQELVFVFTDLCMPNFSGLELKDAIKKLGLNNELKVIACSGSNNYSDDEISDFSNFIQKPYDLEKIRNLIE
ncbi:response regulator [Vibrio tasmaniensis]|uniref:response regulator n=1 Tax=Vibrio tasmaniensis TaxID=212663 RepID=UPI0014369CF0|nr:response regulator [Vibrio tasmaniensis]